MTLPTAPTSSVPRRLRLPGFFAILIIVVLSSTLSVAGEEPPDDSASRAPQGDSALTYPTNAQFVRRGVGIATRRGFEGFPFVRPKPLWITTAEGQKTNFWFEETASRVLFDRGFVVQEAPGEDTASSALWAVRYRFDRFNLSLPRTARHSFLGRIWVERVFDLSLQLQVWDVESGQLLWSNSVDSTWTDWVPKRRLKDLSEATSTFLSPAPPTTGLERFAEPAMIIAAAGALTALFFVVR